MNIQHQTKCSIAFIPVLILIWLLIINSNDLRPYLRLQLSRNKVSMDSVCCQSSLWQSFGVWEDEGGPLCGELTPISRRNQKTGSHSYPLPSFIFTFLCLHLLMCHRSKNVWLLHFAEYHFTTSLLINSFFLLIDVNKESRTLKSDPEMFTFCSILKY